MIIASSNLLKLKSSIIINADMTRYSFYTDLAKYYDKIYHYVDYEKQAEFFINLVKKYGAVGSNKALDFACGTGKHAGILHKKGYGVIGVDLSRDMLAEARKKYPNVKFYLGDMKSWKGSIKYGVIIIFYNSILYNKSKVELKAAFKNCYDQLQENGLLIFDTVDKSIGVDSEAAKIKYADDNLSISFSPQWIYNPKNDFMDLEINFIINGQKIHDRHVMGAFSLKEQKQLAEDAGFEVLILKRSFDKIRRHSAKDKAVIFVCRKTKD